MTAMPQGGRGARTTTMPDNHVTAAAVSRDADAMNVADATNVIHPWGAHDLRGAAETET
jgi:hypothetical protein